MKLKLYLVVALCGLPLLAQSPTVINRNAKWPPQAGSSYSFGGPFEIAWQPAPTSSTDVVTHSVRLISVTVSNTTSGALTFTLQTKDGSPLALPLSGSIPANTAANFNIPAGLLSTGGINVQASGSGLLYSLVWTN